VTAGSNSYCERLGIAVPSLAEARKQRDANTYALLIVALLERGAPMTLTAVAERFDAAGIAPAAFALDSLKRCRPARPPLYRDGDLYALDPHDAELDLWLFRLGLRPPTVVHKAPSPPPPRPPNDQRLSASELDAAWGNDASLSNWSAQRIALAVLDAHDGPMRPEDVVAFVAARTKDHKLQAVQPTFRRKNSAVLVLADDTWAILPGAPELAMARAAVRDAVEQAHRSPRTSSDQWAASIRAAEKRGAAHAAELAALSRVIVHAVPAKAPRAAVLVDVERRELTTLLDDQLETIAARLKPYDVLTGVDIRGTLRALGVDPADRRLAEIGPPQKSIGPMKITMEMLVFGSCRIRRALGDPKQLADYLAKGQRAQLTRRLEADAKALYALHQYGRLHGMVRLRSGGLDEIFAAPWHHIDEPSLYHLKKEARALAMGIVAVVGAAPDWDDPWSGAQLLHVERGSSEYDLVLVDAYGRYVDDRDLQLARLELAVH
jgi:hypothetical protein